MVVPFSHSSFSGSCDCLAQGQIVECFLIDDLDADAQATGFEDAAFRGGLTDDLAIVEPHTGVRPGIQQTFPVVVQVVRSAVGPDHIDEPSGYLYPAAPSQPAYGLVSWT